uniref:Zinc finger ZPR1-type domain-containing protein n=1 Tax=Meloidogyne javanica TaxID=6303 RepID=A0A915MRE1_MELJA
MTDSTNSITLPSTSQHDFEDVEKPMEIESICPNCHENGITKIISINIPFYRQVIVMSFACEHCGLQNNNLQSGEQAQEYGTEIVLKVKNAADLNRTVVRSEYGIFEIPELELTIPPKSSSGALTTVEGVLQSVKQDLGETQPLRKQLDAVMADKIDQFLEKLDKFLSLENSWTLVSPKLRDPSGNCFIQNPNPFHVDPHCITSHYCRSIDEEKLLGFLDDDQVIDLKQKIDPAEQAENEWKSYQDVKNEVMHFMGPCQSCGAICETRMKPTDIPYFQTVIIMSTDCDCCGFKSNDVKSGGVTQDKGIRLSLRIKEPVDLKRDLLKSDTCSVHIPEIDTEVGAGILCGRFTTVEGLLMAICEQLERQAPFFVGDSCTDEERRKFVELIERMKKFVKMEEECTLVLDDPSGNSYIQSLTAPLNDERLDKEFYTRTFEQDDDLGLNDMRVDNYENLASTSAESPNYAELIDRLTRQLRILESENLEFRRSIPHLKDYKGEDCTKFVTGKLNELEEHKGKYRRAVDRLAELNKQFQQFKVDANERAQEGEKQLYELRTIADALENENTMVTGKLNELEEHKGKYRRAVDRIAEQFQHFKVDANERAQKSEKQLHELRTIADALEDENTMLRDQLKNKDTIIRQLQKNVFSSTENLNRSAEEGPSHTNNNKKSCSKCSNIKEERDRLKTQLNREISLKNECLATNDDLDKKLQEARKTIEEMRRKQLVVCNDIIEKGRNDRRVLLNNRPEVPPPFETPQIRHDLINNERNARRRQRMANSIARSATICIRTPFAQILRERSEQRCRA